MTRELQIETERLVEQYRIKCAEFTEKQRADCIKAAIECGDFVRYVSHRGQCVVYMPEKEVFRLRSRVKALEELLEQNDIELPL